MKISHEALPLVGIEVGAEHTAGGRRMAASVEDRCPDISIAPFYNAFWCALPVGHDGDHESASGTSWER